MENMTTSSAFFSFTLPLLLTSSLSFLSLISTTDADIGFSASLIHRESPLLPETIQSNLSYGVGIYYMEYFIGTPKVKQYGIVDTGSDLVWLQCEPCEKCYKQTFPVFDPKSSKTHKKVQYNSPICNDLGHLKNSTFEGNLCRYCFNYVDDSGSKGDLATEKFIIVKDGGKSETFKDVVIGCGHNNSADKSNQYASGVIGLGGGPLSFVSQIGAKGKFSYCLVHHSQKRKKSFINFGSTGFEPGRGEFVSTPLVDIEGEKTLYRVTLQAIILGTDTLYYTGKGIRSQGNMIVDLGTQFTYVNPTFHKRLKTKLVSRLGTPIKDPENHNRLCFGLKRSAEETLPTVTLQLSGGKLNLPTENTFVKAKGPNIWCFNILHDEVDSLDQPAVLGAWAQANFLVGYDTRDQKKIYFQPQDCTRKIQESVMHARTVSDE